MLVVVVPAGDPAGDWRLVNGRRDIEKRNKSGGPHVYILELLGKRSQRGTPVVLRVGHDDFHV